MRILYGTLLGLLLPLGQYTSPLRVPPVSGPTVPTYSGIHGSQAQGSASLGLSIILTGVPGGSSIYILQTHQTDTNYTGITDSLGTPVVISGTSVNWNASSSWSSAYKVENATSGTHTIAMVCTSFCGYNDLSAYVFTGVPGSGTTESGVSSGASGAPPTCSSVTTTGTNEVVLPYSWVYNGGYVLSVGSGYTSLPMDTTDGIQTGHFAQYKLMASAGTYTPTFGGSTTGDASMCVAFAIK